MSAVASYYRLAGLSYLQYVNIGASALRRSLKEPAKAAALARDEIHFRERSWVNGEGGDRTDIDNVFAKGPLADLFKKD